MDEHGRINHAHRTMHVLDVITSFTRSSKCTKVVGLCGFAPDPAYSASPYPLAGFKGPTLTPLLLREKREGEEWGEGHQNDLCPRAPETLSPSLNICTQSKILATPLISKPVFTGLV